MRGLPPLLPGRRVALVHDWLTGMRGGENVLAAIAHLFPAAPIFTLLHVPGSVSPELEAHPIHTSFLQRLPGTRRGYRRYLPLFPQAVESLDLSGYDVVISSSHCVAKGVLPDPGAYHLCYCHTPMRYAWDQERAYFPRRRGVVARLRGLVLSALRVWDVASAARVDDFVANSSFVARRIRRYWGREATVIHPPVEVERFAGAPPGGGDGGADGDFALVVAALAPYKRVEVAVEACRRRSLPLVVVGDGPERRRLESRAAVGTRFLGRVEADELGRLYRRARLFLQPGVEDFGIAPVEALAAGTPVVARGAGGVLDIVDDGRHGVLYHGTDDASALAEAIDRALGIRFNELDLRHRAEGFSAQRFSDALSRHLEERLVLGREPHP